MRTGSAWKRSERGKKPVNQRRVPLLMPLHCLAAAGSTAPPWKGRQWGAGSSVPQEIRHAGGLAKQHRPHPQQQQHPGKPPMARAQRHGACTRGPLPL